MSAKYDYSPCSSVSIMLGDLGWQSLENRLYDERLAMPNRFQHISSNRDYTLAKCFTRFFYTFYLHYLNYSFFKRTHKI